MKTNQLTKLAIAALEDLKGIDIQVIDVSPLTSITDHLVIATGTSTRHVKAMASSVIDKALEAGVRPLSAQGLEQGEWALVDLNGVVVHTLQASARAHYQLEKLWDLGQAKPVLNEPQPAKKAKAAAKKAAPMKKPASAKKAVAAKPLAKPAVSKAAAKKAVAKTAIKKGSSTPVAAKKAVKAKAR